MTEKQDLIMTDSQIKRALTRIAHEVLERNVGAESLAVVGIITRGAHLAKRIAKIIEEIEGVKVPVGLMDIGLYRDDVHSGGEQPVVQRTDILFDVIDKNIILVDDVLFTGRTVRAALDHIIDFGRPRTIQLAVLVDRGHRELPIKADYVGLNIPTAHSDQVVLEVKEKDGVDKVYVLRGALERPTSASPAKKRSPAKKAKAKSARKSASKSSTKKGGRK